MHLFKLIKNTAFKFSAFLLLFVAALHSPVSLQAQQTIEVSVPFDDGFIGLIGQNTQQATNIQRFSTLTIARAYFVQQTVSGRFENQGNDIPGTLRLQLNNGRKVDLPGALVWRINSGNTNEVLGFLANSNVSVNLNAFGGPNYTIQGGTANGRSNFGFKLNNSTYTLKATGQTESGNAANVDVSLLNSYLDAIPRVIAPSPRNFALNASNQDPGDFSLVRFPNGTLLCSIGLVNPPAGTTFNLSVTSGLTRSTGYNSWTGLTRISFTGTQAAINAALASMTVSTGSNAGNINISVSATLNPTGYFYFPPNGHFYKPMSWPAGASYTGASATPYNNLKALCAQETYRGQAGYLMTITSAEEDNFVNNNVPGSNIIFALTDKDLEGTFKIDDGPEAGTIVRVGATNQPGVYNNWDTGEPNNWGTGEDYVVTKWSGGSRWNDFGPEATAFPGSISGYVIEFGTWTNPDDQAFTDFYSASTSYTATCLVNPAAPTVVTQATRAGAGTVQLTVSVPAGTTADWYATETGGTVLAGGSGVSTFTTPIITATTNYYVQTRNTSTGCLSPTRTLVTATVVPCPTTPPNIQFKLSPPDVTTSAIQGQVGSRTESFNSMTTGVNLTTGNFAVGSYTKNNLGTLQVLPTSVWGGTGTNFLAIYQSAVVSINLTDPSRYVGFWWGAGDPQNTVTIYGSCGGNEIQLGQFNTSTVINLLSQSTITAVDGTSYPTSQYKRSNAAGEPFAYINLQLDDPNIYFTRLEFGGGGFEVDNITTSTGYGAATATTPTAPTITSITAGSGSASVAFTAPSSNGGAAITNYEYSTNGGTSWTAFSPAITTSPATIPSLANGTQYAVRIRAVNSIGSGISSNGLNVTPVSAPPVISSFSPSMAGNGEAVVITGTGFTGATAVRFGNVNATSFTVNSDTQITAIVGAARSGDVYVQNAIGNDTETGFVFKVVQYNFEGNALDHTEANLDGTVSGAVTYGTGVEGQAVCFDRSSNNWIVLPSNLIRNLSDFTISMRFKTTSKGVLLGYQNNEVNSSLANQYIPIIVVQSDGRLRATLWTTTNTDMSIVSTNTVNDGNWHKIDMAITPTSINIYIDGVLAGSTNSGTVAHLQMSFNQLGRGRTDAARESVGGDLTGWQGFTGCIDNFLILDKGQSLATIAQVTQVPQPTITNFTPTATVAGTVVTITGTNFTGATSVLFAGVPVQSFTVVSNTQITAVVGNNTSASGNVEVITAGGTASASGFSFTAANTPPTITSMVNQSTSGTTPTTAQNFTVGDAETAAASLTVTASSSNTTLIPTNNIVFSGSGANRSVVVTAASGQTGTATITLTVSDGAGATATSTFTVTVNDPNCSTFSPLDFQLNGNATVSNNIITLTTATGNQRGGAWNKNKIFLDKDFDISSRINLGTNDATGADGIAFVLQNQSINAGSSGGGLGYQGITPSFAVEFDTWYNGPFEPVQDHMAIIANGAAAGAHNTYATPFEVQMEDGQWHNVRFVWTANTKNFQAWYDGVKRFDITVDLKATIFNNAEYVFWGLTAATGGSVNLQQVEITNYCYTKQASITPKAGTNNASARLNLCTGSDVVLEASNADTYQWFKDNVAIAGATGQTLTVADAGSYKVETITNGITTVSEATTVTVSALPSITYPSATYSFIRDNTITSMAPVLASGSATPSSYSVSPALPTGLTLNTTTGVISGRPTALAATANYTVTANTAAGCSTTFSLSIEVKNDVAPSNLVYNPNSQTVRQGTAITNMLPTVSGGAVITYTIAPSLPSGITINATTGIVSGTLSSAQTGSQVYTVTATNTGGTATATITLIYNSAPTDIASSASSIAENNAANATVGTLSSTDPDAGDTHTYTLVSGTGSTDNAAFNISGNSLRVNAALDFETKSSYSIRIRTTDAGGLTFEKVFTISVTNANEAPTNISSTQLAIYENNTANATVGNLTATDPDAGDTHTYTLVSGAGSTDNSSFSIVNNQLKAAVVFKFKDKESYNIRIRTTDAGGLTFEKTFTITIIESPVASATGNLPGTNQITAASNDVTISKGYSSQLNVAGPGLVTYNWSPSIGLSATNVANPIASPLQTTVYTVTVTNALGLSTVLYVTVNVVEDYNVTPSNIITPNGDGINDYWVIDNLDSYPDNEVQIFDKAGRVLYQVKDYQNNWDGTINSNLLAEGTYYYVINFGSGKKIKKGYITIIRD